MSLPNEWETYTVDLTYDDLLDDTTDSERMEITDHFESELSRLVKKYQGKAGLKIEAKSSDDQSIVEHY